MLVATIHVVGGGPWTCKRGHVVCSASFCISLFLFSVFLFFFLSFVVKMSCCLICNKQILYVVNYFFKLFFERMMASYVQVVSKMPEDGWVLLHKAWLGWLTTLREWTFAPGTVRFHPCHSTAFVYLL
jgi:hypothetical protein